MKSTDKKKPISTIPDGVWESSRPAQSSEQKSTNHSPSASTDLQGNGYPTDKQH